MQLIFLAIFFLILTTVALKKYFWDRRLLYYYSLRFRGAIGLPLVGSLHRFISSKNLADVFKNLSKDYSDLYKLWIGEKLYIVSSRPSDIAIVMKTDLEKDVHLYSLAKDVIGDSLLTADLWKWKSHRKVAAPMLSKIKLVPYTETFAIEAEKLISKLERNCGGGFFDISLHVHVSTLNMVMETLLDSPFESDEIAMEYVSRIHRIVKLFVAKILTGFFWKLTPLSKECDMNIEKVRNIYREVVNSKEIQANRRVSLLSHLIETTKDDESWNLDDRIDFCLTMATTASHSTSWALNFIFTVLGIHQDIQEKVLQEQLSIFDNIERHPTAEDLNQMVYLERVINETLRLFPLAPILARAIQRYVKLDDHHTLPKGSGFIADIMELHRNPKYWPDPLKFDPDRFLPEEACKRPPGVYLPFSLGARNCVGTHYAMMEMKIVVSKFARRFKIESPFKSLSDIELNYDLVLVMEGGCQIALHPRTVGRKTEEM